MRMQEVLVILGDKITAAEDRVDVQECQRLARLGIDTFTSYLLKCETHPDAQEQPQEKG